jgi:hypothetical protein
MIRWKDKHTHNGLGIGESVMKVIVLIPRWIYNKVKSRKVHISNDPWEDIENRMGQSRVHMGDYFIPLREDVKDFLPKKSMKSHKLTKDKVGPRVYTLPWEVFRDGGEEFEWGTNEYER